MTLPGISAVLLPDDNLEGAVLDLAAVLAGLVGERFEIILVSQQTPAEVADVLARAPHLPLRVIAGESVADGSAAASYDVLFTAAIDGQFDVRELNHLLDAIECGSDLAIGYRPRRMDGLMRRFQRWGWRVDLDCAFALVRTEVWRALPLAKPACCAQLLAAVRGAGYRVSEVQVSHRRPKLGTALTQAA